MADLALYESDGPVGYVTLNRPDKLNAISDELRIRASEALERADADTSTRVVVLRGAGRAFSAGYDLGSYEEGDEPHDALWWGDLLRACVDFEIKPLEISKPVIASVQGYALGGGCELTMFCDLTICADDAKFGEPEVRFSDVGPGLIMPFITGHKKAREMLYMGDLIDAQTALECGMINRVVPAAELEQATRAYAQRLATIDKEALLATKVALRRGMEVSGVRAAVYAGADQLAALYAADTPRGKKFGELANTKGLRAALDWRDAPFAQK